MEQTILVTEVIQEVWEAENGDPDCTEIGEIFRNYKSVHMYPCLCDIMCMFPQFGHMESFLFFASLVIKSKQKQKYKQFAKLVKQLIL